MLSIQTNVASLEAQNFVNINTNFQNNTIEQLSSGYRINQSGDDAAGLATANQYAGTVATLTQGVINAGNSGSTLQIADGGISNISTILNRLQTLATESASSTFAGNRTTVNNEYQGLLQEINRQASAIGLNTGGANNTNLVTYVGGASTAANSQVSVDLSGTNNAVDATALGIENSSVAGGGTTFANNNVNLNNLATTFVSGAANASQTFTFQVATPTGDQQVQAVVNGSVAGITGANAITQLNSQLSQYGITASIASAPGTTTDQTLQFGGQTAFTVSIAAVTNAGAGSLVAAAATQTAVNTADYNLDSSSGPVGAFAAFASGATETVNFASGSGSQTVTLDDTNAGSLSQAVDYLNNQLNGIGISAVSTNAGNISFQSTSSFNVNEINYTANGGTGNLFGGATGGAAGSTGAVTVTPPSTTASDTGNAIAALQSLSTAISNLGLTQGIVGAGENKLNYATNLAQSQITNFSAAESGIKDANIAQEAANLTKAQVLQQASLAALAQANTAPQAVLALLKG
jgi:flagellin